MQCGGEEQKKWWKNLLQSRQHLEDIGDGRTFKRPWENIQG
jgi:hypothetical protein